MGALPVMPFAPGVSLTKPGANDGDVYGENDPEFWERADSYFDKNGTPTRGLREHRHLPYPKMLFKAKNELRDPRESFERQIAQTERHQADIVAGDPAWQPSKAEATAYLTAKRDDESKHAAEAAYKADRMTAPAKRAYTKRAASSPKHAQE
jgi:hypothetical protein